MAIFSTFEKYLVEHLSYVAPEMVYHEKYIVIYSLNLLIDFG